MKKVLTVLAIMAVASASYGAAIGLEWAGNTANAESAATGPATPVTARMYISNGSAVANQRPITGAMALQLRAWEDAACTIPANLNVFQVSATSPLAGWSTAPANKNVDLNGLQFAAVAGPNTFLAASTKTYTMDIQLQWVDATPLPKYYITIERSGSAILDDTGGDYMTNDAIWFDSGFATAGKAKWGFGNWGGGAWSRYDGTTYSYIGQSANPLVLNTPEPASLALLVLGGLAALRRRN